MPRRMKRGRPRAVPSSAVTVAGKHCANCGLITGGPYHGEHFTAAEADARGLAFTSGNVCQECYPDVRRQWVEQIGRNYPHMTPEEVEATVWRMSPDWAVGGEAS